MRKITILEVLDRARGEFVPIRQAIHQGLFNTRTYLFFDPVDQRHYSISEAASLGLFKAAIEPSASAHSASSNPNATANSNSNNNNNRAALIIERTKLTQTVYLLSAQDQQRLVPIREAIDRGLVNLEARTYQDIVSGRSSSLAEAIDRGLVRTKIAREVTERITETLTPALTSARAEAIGGGNSIGLVKRIETTKSEQQNQQQYNNNNTSSSPLLFSCSNDNLDQHNEEISQIREVNGLFMLDRTKSLSVNKRMKKYSRRSSRLLHETLSVVSYSFN